MKSHTGRLVSPKTLKFVFRMYVSNTHTRYKINKSKVYVLLSSIHLIVIVTKSVSLLIREAGYIGPT